MLDIEEKLNAAFGTHTVHSWPCIPPTRARWWQRVPRRTEARINQALAAVGLGPVTEEIRAEFWRQVRMGQCIYEDAGGYDLRCWLAALGLPYTAHHRSYRQAVADLVDEANAEVPPS